jgi:hypothetical protein
MNARVDPLVIGAMGGSGTRVFTKIARHAGLFMGGHVDGQEDSRSMSPFYNEFATAYLAANGDLDSDHSDHLCRRFTECLRDHLEGLPAPDHPWGIKNPRSILMLRFWHQRFPSMRFLHVIRSGLDMAYSDAYNQVRRHGNTVLDTDLDLPRAERMLLWWDWVNGMAADYGEAELGARYLRVRLEDLCSSPKRTIRDLFDFVGKEGRVRPAVAEVTTPATLERWRDQPADEVAHLVDLGRASLERFGYIPNSLAS